MSDATMMAPAEWVPNADAGDSSLICSVCHCEVLEPHSYKECAEGVALAHAHTIDALVASERREAETNRRWRECVDFLTKKYEGEASGTLVCGVLAALVSNVDNYDANREYEAKVAAGECPCEYFEDE